MIPHEHALNRLSFLFFLACAASLVVLYWG